MNILETRRRDLVAGPLVAMAAMGLDVKLGKAAGVDPIMTIIKRPDEIPCKRSTIFRPEWRNRPQCTARSTLRVNISC
jgi:hypothetical protein